MWWPFSSVGTVAGGLGLWGAALAIIPAWGVIDSVHRQIFMTKLSRIGQAGFRTRTELIPWMGHDVKDFGSVLRWDWGNYSIALEFSGERCNRVLFIKEGRKITHF